MTDRHLLPHWAPRETGAQLLAIPRYLRVISLSKILLGALVVALIGVVIVLPLTDRGDSGMRIAFDKLPQVTHTDQPKMLNPQYESIDTDNQPFSIRAKEAIQQDFDSVRLIGLQADIALKQGSWIALQAEQGLLQIGRKKLLLQGSVHVYSDDGNEFTTPRVLVNLATGDAWGPDGVSGQGAMGTITAGNFQFSAEHKAIRFANRVKLILYP